LNTSKIKEKIVITIFVARTERSSIRIPYRVQLIEHIKKLTSIKKERSLTDLVLYDLIICGIKEITEVKDAIKPTIVITTFITY